MNTELQFEAVLAVNILRGLCETHNREGGLEGTGEEKTILS